MDSTLDRERDGDRLARQMRDVLMAVDDGGWYTLTDLEQITGHPQASISARLRDLRKPKHGGRTVDKHYVGHGLWLYRLAPEEE